MEDPAIPMPLFWLAILAGLALCWPLAQCLRHPRQRPLAAWLIFTSALIGVAAVLFSALVAIAMQVLPPGAAESGATALIVLVLALAPALAAAGWLVRRPPDRRMPK